MTKSTMTMTRIWAWESGGAGQRIGRIGGAGGGRCGNYLYNYTNEQKQQ